MSQAINACRFVFRENQDPDAYVIYADDQSVYALCPRCVMEPFQREFPIYADELEASVRCGHCDHPILRPNTLLLHIGKQLGEIQ